MDYQADIDAIGRISAVPTILDVVCRTTGMGFAAVARVTPDRWIACSVKDDIAFGLEPGGELKVETTICHEIRQSGEAVVINHVAEDPAYCGHPTPAMYGFQSYISMPIVLKNGQFFGTLCAIDPRPNRLDKPETLGMFKLFADLIAFHLDSIEQLANSEARLSAERENAELREQFIAVLGHDLRNPLASLDAGTRILLREGLSEKGRGVAAMMQSSALRMAGLIENVMDFARGRLGGGVRIEPKTAPLEPLLAQVVAELQTAWPNRIIETDFSLPPAVNCDHDRIGQLLSNLVGNALKHGSPDGPVRVSATTTGEVFELSIRNQGAEIPPAALAKIFKPFVRGDGQHRHEGLGLGLYISSEIAKAHGGTLEAASSPEETRFTLRIPLA
jgi:signal transduction histidine kinase